MILTDSEQRDLVQGFVEESREMLDNVEPLLIELEQESDNKGDIDPEVVNTIFRLFHSLKGGAGFLGFSTVGRVTHEAETLLDFFRKGQASLNSDHVDLLIRTCDFIGQLLNHIEAEFNDKGFEEAADDIVQTLRKAITDINHPGNAPLSKKKAKGKTEKKTAERKPVSPPDAEMPADPGHNEAPQTSDENLELTISEEMVKQFIAESDELLEKAEEAFLMLEKEPNDAENLSTAFRALHSFKGNAASFGYNDLKSLSHQMENALDLLREGDIKGDGELFSLLLDILDYLRDGVSKISRGEEPKLPALTGWSNLLQETLSAMETSEKETASAEASAPALQTPPAAKAFPSDDTAVSKPVNAVSGSTAPREERRSGNDRRQHDRRSTSQTVRVDVEKLDSLLDLVGELVIAEAMVAQNPDLKGLDVSMDRFERSVMQLKKISRDIQDIATSIRMIPLAGTFKRMIRLVRDLSHKAGKKVELELIGEETEVDKTVIEQINDPLVHIIRNSIDHGIEPPAERTAAGKSETGKVTLEAKYVGGEVWITITDDGQGLNREKIVQKAVERGLIQGDGSDLRDEEVWLLIFHPGFSTADQITDISGRGVGMDVVKRNIENIRGKVGIRSVPGQGSSIILRIPLTLAIIDGMLVRVGNTRYTIPLIAIKESLQPKEKDITITPDGQEIVSIRGRLLPVVRLHNLFGVEPEFRELHRGIIIVVENQGDTICLFVDEQLGQQQIVIKGLSDYIGCIPGVSGCTILGDGDISLIIDIAGVINSAATRGKSKTETIHRCRQTEPEGKIAPATI